MNHHIYTYEEVKFKLLMRRHAEDHVIWLRSYMVSLLANLPDIDIVKERLYKSQDAVGNCMREFFEDTVIDNMISLRKEYVSLIIDLFHAIKSKDSTKISSIEEDLVTNTENIAILLSTANPLYSKDELIDMLNTHVILVKYEFMARMSEDYNTDIVYLDMSMYHITMLSDYLTKGIIEKFFTEQNLQIRQLQT